MPLLLQACISFLKIGAFSFGGGYAVLAFIQREVVEGHGWIAPDNFVNIVAIAEMTPGPIAVNSSTFVGYHLGGIPGGIVCSISTLLIPFLLALIASIFFTKFKDSKSLQSALAGIRPAVIGLIAASCLSIGKISFSGFESVIFFGIALLMVWKFKVNPILALVSCGVLGAGYYGLIAPFFA
ncbi:MAG: chromate transporter [Clostridia bacterium]|nr:chromate transporter [Clostridia bacterium]